MNLNPFIIDCDTGRDDALAIWLALSLDLPLAGIVASYGNTTLENVTDNCMRVLALLNREDIPVMPGATKASKDHKGYREIVIPRQQTSGNGICNIELPVPQKNVPAFKTPEELAESIIALYQKHGQLDYIIIGPSTNFSNLCNVLGKDIHAYIRRVTKMGGKLDSLWNEMPGADFNLVCDPFALETILEQKLEFRFVTMNTTWNVKMHIDEVEKLNAETELAKTAKDLMIAHCRNFTTDPFFRFHDPCLVLAASNDEDFVRQKMIVNTDEANDNFARLIDDDHGYPIQIFHSDATMHKQLLRQILTGLGFLV